MIPQSFIQDLLNRVDIVGVVERYVKLRRAGANYLGLCPFHNEKTPSFTVSATKQFYHCFGCGAHGSAIGFLMEYGGLGYVDAIKDLAQSVGLVVPEVRSERGGQSAEESAGLRETLFNAAQYYRSQLKDAAHAIAYLKGRGVTGEVARRFGIGYAPAGWQNLAAACPDYNAPALVAAGLVKQSDEGRRYDLFRDRIMFPILDQRGNVIGFGGRVLQADGAAAAAQASPKYLNSPETAVFEKGRELYGLFQAARAIRDRDTAVGVEGYMDVVALAQHGIEYVVATLGTATTPVHVQKLLRLARRVVYCFDGDDAGRRAAWRALENTLEQTVDGKEIGFLFLPQGDDPDSYVRRDGSAAFEALIGAAMPLSDFLVEQLSGRTSLRSAEGRARLLQEAKPLVKRIAAPLTSLLVRKRLAGLAGITVEELDVQYEIRRKVPMRAKSKPMVRRSLARKLIELTLLKPGLAGFADRSELADFAVVDIDPAEINALNALLEVAAGDLHIVSMAEYFRGGGHEDLLRSIEADLPVWHEGRFDDAALEHEFRDAWMQLLDQARRARARALLETSRQRRLSAEEQAELRQALTAAQK
jgi:DNA primase